MPTREELDRIAPNHPVHVQALYVVAQMNTAGIKASGITGATPNPHGGVLEKDAHGNFTGVVPACGSPRRDSRRRRSRTRSRASARPCATSTPPG